MEFKILEKNFRLSSVVQYSITPELDFAPNLLKMVALFKATAPSQGIDFGGLFSVQ